MTKARDIADFKFENITDTGTEGTKIALGTTAQRGSSAGQLRYNSTLSRFEATGNGTEFVGFATPPTITSISPTILDSAGGETVVITGTNFVVGATTVTFDGSSPSSVTVNSTTQITVTGTPAKSGATYTNGLVVNAGGSNATFTFTTSGVPAFTSSAGSLGSFNEGTSVGTLDAGTDIGTAHVVSIGSLPSGVSINSSNGEITGTLPANTNTAHPPEGGGGDITTTFTVQATDAENQTSTRQFSIGNKQGDPLWTSTICVLNAENSLTTNSGYNNNTITASNVVLSTTQKKFGSKSYYSAGSTSADYIDIAVPSSQRFDQISDICFEGFFYLETNRGNVTGNQSGAYANQSFFSVRNTYFNLYIDSNGRVGLYQYTGAETYQGQWATTGNISTGQWYHVAFQCSSSDIKYWLDGTYIGSLPRNSSQYNPTPSNYNVFSPIDNISQRAWIGYADDIRITAGTRYTGTGSIIVPTETTRLFAS
tara:strand:+ start:981 stop:2426 length:1446 start_codon:yes stop_codon:yes gene_type:complete